MGAVELAVADLERSLAFYRDVVGLRIASEGAGRAGLGAGGEELVVLAEVPGGGTAAFATGLYHFALLVPQRVHLARWLAHAARERIELVGLSDHFVSEAIYLTDPDGHGIEIYWDRPRESWEGLVAERMTTLPLDTRGLLGELDDPATEPFEAIATGTVIGHVHLKVADVVDSVRFYRDVLGFGLMAQLGSSAAFLGAGGYHHHIGANSWQSAGAAPPPAGSAALLRATIVLPDEAARERVLTGAARRGYGSGPSDAGPVLRDPSGIALALSVAGSG